MAKKFSKRTKGFNGPVFVAPAINYTTDASLALFLANAPTGEIGLYDAVDALHNNAITSAEKFYIVQKLAGGIKKTPLLALADVVVTKKTYVAPVKQVSAIGWNGTGGSLNLDTIAAGKGYEFAIIETTEGYEPFPRWNFNYSAKSGDTQMEIIQALAKQVNDFNAIMYTSNEPLVSAKVKADATYGNYAIGAGGTLTVTKDSATVVTAVGTIDFAVGDYVSFDASGTPSDSIGDIYKIIAQVDANTWTLNRAYTGATQTFTEAEAEGTRVKKVTSVVAAGIVFTALNDDEHFRIAVREELENAAISYVTAYVKGNGTYDEVANQENEGEVWEGDTAKNTEFAANFGQQGKQSVAGETYDAYMIQYTKKEGAIAPESVGFHNGTIVIWVARSAGDVDTTLNTLFGV